jgi:dTDP-4-dehydrorhamnose reductase
MKVLLFGKNGQLGWELQRSLAPLGELVALGARGESMPCDFNDPDRLAETVRQVRPDVIVNAAAYTAVDKAQSDRETAHRVNALAPGVLARAAHQCGALMVHYSTDYVFDGSGERPWREADPTGPLNVYGATKLEGEQRVANEGARHLIFRTSWVYSARGSNFAKTILRLAQERDRLQVVDDQFGAPTGADWLADVTAHAIRATLQQASCAGVYHAAAAGETTWHGYARQVLGVAQAQGVALRTTSDRVEPVGSEAFPTPARRPGNSRLDTAALHSAFDLSAPDWRVGVERMLCEVLAGRS